MLILKMTLVAIFWYYRPTRHYLNLESKRLVLRSSSSSSHFNSQSEILNVVDTSNN